MYYNLNIFKKCNNFVLMDKTLKIFAGVILFIFTVAFFTAPLMAKRKAIAAAKSTVKKVLDYWQNADAATGKSLWENPTKFPAIYDLKSYKILNAATQKTGKNSFLTKVDVFIHFGSDSGMPAKESWAFEIKQDGIINTVSDFYLLPEE